MADDGRHPAGRLAAVLHRQGPGLGREQALLAGIAGDFPGSPVTLAFGVVLADDRMERLTIRPADG
ncbi:hypothetical protein [Actinomycetospora chibensis]|uniref:Uncharacterized protein n=1 Tax=Actinomycetospora chibensis TaxID=663606 RepID=A0ABV9RG76_9PSEU|nr:hypothetical protein [Actinomycetospora chibensis]MDD7926761.1 hypothetical protein [Actinomycetospora chibensis]